MILGFLRSLLCPNISKLERQIETLTVDNQELELRVSLLSTALEDSFVVISAEELTDVESAKEIYPYTHPILNDYELTVADLKYYGFSKDEWIALLDEVHPFLIGLIGEWTENVADCDDFSLIMNAFIASSFIRAGYDLQGAFFIAHSRTHAYNVFVDSAKRAWVYEPQTNGVVGLVGEVSEPYDTKKILAVGEQTKIIL